jgi:hypothetical protein
MAQAFGSSVVPASRFTPFPQTDSRQTIASKVESHVTHRALKQKEHSVIAVLLSIRLQLKGSVSAQQRLQETLQAQIALVGSPTPY